MFLKYVNKIITLLRNSLKRKTGKRSIAVLCFKFLGDTVFTIPALELLQRSYPGYKITIFCYPESKAIYELFFKDINYECYGRKDWDLESRKPNLKVFRGMKRIRSMRFEMVIDFTVLYKSALICFYSGTGVSVGFGNKLLEGFYDYFSLKNKNCHLMDMFISSLEKILPQNFRAQKEFPVNLKEVKKILIHPSAGWRAKEWNYGKYIELGNRLENNFKIEFIAEKESLSADKIEELRGQGIDLISSETIHELVESVKNSDLIVSNDTGIIYIAGLMGKPTFTIYGPTNPEYSLPFGKYHRYIQKKIVCSPKTGEQYCYLEAGKKCPLFECMNRLTVEEVYEELNNFISVIKIERILD